MFYSSTSRLCCKMAVQLGIKGEVQNGKITDSSSIICLNPYLCLFPKTTSQENIISLPSLETWSENQKRKKKVKR